MSYIFSRALVEEFLEANYSESEPSAPLNSNPTPQAYCSPARMTAYSRLSRYGMTYAPLTDDRGAALLTWYREAFRARTFQPQEKAPALTAPAPGSGGKCTELSMRYDRNSHSWKTHLCLWEEDLPESSVILPKSGTMRNGLCWERTTWEPHTSGNASGYLHMIPTPTACNAPNKGSHSRGPKSLLDVASTGWMPGMMWPTATTRGLDGGTSSRKALLKKRRMDWNSNRFREEAEREVSGGGQAAQSTRVCRDVSKPPCLGSQETWSEQQATGIVRICPDVSYSPSQGLERQRLQPRQSKIPEPGNDRLHVPYPADKRHVRGDGEFPENERLGSQGDYHAGRAETNDCGEWWSAEPDVGRVAHGVAARVDRIKAIGNGQVPAVAATAFLILFSRFQDGKEFTL
jgi:hypothetical protein